MLLNSRRSSLLLGLMLAVSHFAHPAASGLQADEKLSKMVALNLHASELLSKPARLKVQEVRLIEALRQLGESSGVPLSYSTSVLPTSHQVSCDCSHVSVATALEKLLSGIEVRFREAHGQVLLYPAKEQARRAQPVRLPSIATPLAVPLRPVSGLIGPQEAAISGIVVNQSTGEPVAGAVVQVAGMDRSALTNAAGRFLMVGFPGGREFTLVVTMLGYRTARQAVQAGDTNVRIELVQTAIDLDRIVVTGTAGGVQKRAVGNSVSQVDAGDVLELAPVKDFGQLLNGRAAGVAVQPRSGVVGAGPRIRIRGSGTFSLSDQPILIVDGVRIDNRSSTGPGGSTHRNFQTISRLNDFDPNQIESIEVIKGPAAATLYGTEAANGVIQIITKKGRTGAPVFEMTMRQGANWLPNAAGRFQPGWGLDPTTGDVSTLNIIEHRSKLGQDIFRTGRSQGYTLSVSGGTDDIRYYASANLEDEEGIEPTNNASRYGGRLNIDLVPSDQLRLGTGLGLNVNDVKIPSSWLWWSLWRSRPSLLDNNTQGWGWAPAEEFWENLENRQKATHVTWNAVGEHRPFPWLTQRLNVGLDLTNESNEALIRYMDDESVSFFGKGMGVGSRDVERLSVSTTTFDYAATAETDVNESLTSATSAGIQYYKKRIEAIGASGEAFPAVGLETVSSTSQTLGSESLIENSTLGFYIQERIGWRDRLFLTAALRADDNSAFGENFDFVTYPKFSAAWLISEEPFWTFSTIDAFRLRGAYGESGQQPSTFAAIRLYRPVSAGSGEPSISTRTIGNPDLGPERGQEIEAGFDVDMFSSRLGLEFTYYYKRTDDAILLRQIPPSLGFTGQQFFNAGEIKNTGMELSLNGRPISRENVTLDLNAQLATNDNEILSLGDGVDFISVNGQVAHKVGYPVGSWFQRKIISASLDENGQAQNVLCDDGSGQAVSCDDAPRMFLGYRHPDYEGSFSTTLTLFSRLRLFALVDFSQGQKNWNAEESGRCLYTRMCRINFYPEEYDPVRVAYINRATDAFLEPFIQDASYTKLREVSASYTIPEAWAGRVGATRAVFTVSGRNLYSWDSWYSFDPESTAAYGAGEQIRHTSLDISTTPQLTQFLVSLKLTF